MLQSTSLTETHKAAAAAAAAAAELLTVCCHVLPCTQVRLQQITHVQNACCCCVASLANDDCLVAAKSCMTYSGTSSP